MSNKRQRSGEDSEFLGVNVPRTLKRELEVIAQKREQTVSQFVRLMLQRAVVAERRRSR